MNDETKPEPKGRSSALVKGVFILTLICGLTSVILNLAYPEFQLGWIFDLLTVYLIPTTIFIGIDHIKRTAKNKKLKVAALSLNIVLFILFVFAHIFLAWLLLNSGPVPGKASQATTLNRNAITSVRAWQFSEGIDNYEGMTLEKLQEENPDIGWIAENQDIGGDNVNRVSIYMSDDKVIIATQDDQSSGKCYFSLITSKPILSGKATHYSSAESDTCSASLAPDINERNWSSNTTEGWIR